jgi:RES domain-containing protein
MPRRHTPAFTAWKGVAYRATSYDVPLWVNPNRRNGRWNIAEQHCVQYLCLDTQAPLAEALRQEDLRTKEAASHYSTTVWQLQIDDGAVVDYSTFELAELAGFDAGALVEDDHERCQAEAQWLISQGARGVLSPSAALPGSTNLTLFGPRVCVPWNTTTALASSIPAQKLTTGHPPALLTTKVRYFGESEPLLLAYIEAPDRQEQRQRP